MKPAPFKVFPFVLAACLTACFRDTRDSDIKECSAETQRNLSQEQLANRALADQTKEERHDAIGGMIAACMESHGYRHDDGAMTDERCVNDVDYNPYCYAKSR